MAVHFSSSSTVQLPRLLIAMAVIVCIAGAASFAVSGGPSVSVILPASVVFGMGLYFNGARRYEVMDDKIRILGVVGQRDLRFEKIRGFDDNEPESFGSRLQSFLTGAPLSSAIKLDADRSFFSQQNYLWVHDREAFLRAARDSLTAWHAAQMTTARTRTN